MPLIMPPAFDAVPAIIRVATHKPASLAPAPHPIKPLDTPPPPSGSQAPTIVGKSPVTVPPPAPSATTPSGQTR
jgi:hypothetical protein